MSLPLPSEDPSQHFPLYSMTEEEAAEIRRKEEKRERKRARREERRRRELEQQNMINIETMQSSYMQESNPNPSVISIITSEQKMVPDVNMVQVTMIPDKPLKHKKSKKSKKHKEHKEHKEAMMDIVIDTSQPASLVSINHPMNFMAPSPMIDHTNSISISTLTAKPAPVEVTLQQYNPAP